MDTVDGKRTTQRLGEFLVFLSLVSDEAMATRVAIERAASALEAEVAVLVAPQGVVDSVGFMVGHVPTVDIVAAAAGDRAVLDVPGAGLCQVAVAPLNRHNRGHLVVARSGTDGFCAEELGLLRGMARALELTLETIRTQAAQRREAEQNSKLLASLQRRQRLLEQISRIQRAITRRCPRQEILDAITAGAHRLLGGDLVRLWMRESDDPTMRLASSWGVPAEAPPTADDRIDPVVTAMTAPVHECGAVVGSLEVASGSHDRVYTDSDQEILRVFAEHVSLAITDAKTHEAMRQAFHDPLTGLASRRLFSDHLDDALARASGTGSRVAVLFIDLDRFKIVNDSLGHAAGDSLLVGVADRIRSCLRERDIAGRLGGDEFAVILNDLADAEPAVRVAQRLIEVVRAPFVIDGKETFVEASVGIALSQHEPWSGETLLSNADLAMYHAKRTGRGRCEVFEPALREALLNRLDLEGDLRHAVKRSELVLHYQPVFDLVTEAVTGVEALLRWQHPRRGLLPPNDFIGLAEETGQILPMEIWALSEACRQVAVWNHRRGEAPLTLSVNLSVRRLLQPDLADVVAKTLVATSFPAECLVLEITESLLLQDTDVILHRLRQLERLQVRLAIDDFGTGYSSLAYLRQLPIHVIKIDKSFVWDMTGSVRGNRLARAIVQLGRTLDLTTLAEGIETAEQLAALRKAGCQLGQGFHFARPLPPALVEPLLYPPAPAP